MLVGVGCHRREVVEAFLDRVAFYCTARRRVQLGDDRWRRAFWREQAVPALRLEFRKARFCRRRQIGQGRKPHCLADDEAPDQPVVDRLRHGCSRIADAVNLPTDRVRQRGRRATISDQRHVDAGSLRKTLADQEIRRADAGMSKIDLAGIFLCVGDEVGQYLGRKILA